MHVNGWLPAIYMSYTSQNFRLSRIDFVRSKPSFLPAHVTGVMVQPAWRPSATRRPSPARHAAVPAERSAAPRRRAALGLATIIRSLNWFGSVTDILVTSL